jgi:hypothetical protein
MSENALDLRAMHDTAIEAVKDQYGDVAVVRNLLMIDKAFKASLTKSNVEPPSKPLNPRAIADSETVTGRTKAATAAMLRKVNRPLPLSEIYHGLALEGIHLGGRRPLKQLSSILCTDPIFASTQEGWLLATSEQQRQKASELAEPWLHEKRPTAPTYADLAVQRISQVGKPLTTNEIVEFIGKHRSLPESIRKAKGNIASALSIDDRLENRRVDGIRAWCIVSNTPAINGHDTSHEQSEASK